MIPIQHGRPNSGILFIAGPTGVGKSSLALALAERLGGEIVGADAFQIYTGLPILTAQPTPQDLRWLPHHLIGCISVGETFDVHRYAALAQPALADVIARGKIPLVVGGTGLYFRALIEGFDPAPPPDAGLRAELDALELPRLIERLRMADPDAPARVDVRNKRRVVRAIEIVEGSGRPLAEFRTTPSSEARGLLLVRDREEMQRRIEANVRSMFDAGVIDEVRSLGESVGPTAARAIGLRQIQALLHGRLTRAECETAMITTTRKYAKRQLTWFRNQTRFRSLDLTDTQNPSQAAESALAALDFS
ncbi:MAG: tRNA (adenosine(37)-N6)-dimethylallyltransferase MiaA [Terrimicrobiaceae bacterium]|nr:tRNA (adenosine(37)-N6)-dimethylallyltransferase MiaA [Terrimicrobiaceae bacterium]